MEKYRLLEGTTLYHLVAVTAAEIRGLRHWTVASCDNWTALGKGNTLRGRELRMNQDFLHQLLVLARAALVSGLISNYVGSKRLRHSFWEWSKSSRIQGPDRGFFRLDPGGLVALGLGRKGWQFGVEVDFSK